MRILQVVHNLPELRLAGVELYTTQLAGELALRHDVAVVAPVSELRTPADGRPFSVFGVSPANTGSSLEAQYNGSAAEFIAVLERFAPDLVHVQHLGGLSIRILGECANRQIPSMFTVHDYWLTCAAGGQRFHPRWGPCPLLDATRCGKCTAHLYGPGQIARRVVKRVVGKGDSPPTDTAFPPAPIYARARSRLANALRSGLFGNRRKAERAIETRWRAIQTQLPNVALWLVPSHHLVEELCAFGVARERIEWFPYAVERSRFERRPPPRFARRFGFLGSLVRHKGLHYLIEALPDGCELWVAGASGGDLPFDALLRQLARGRRVRFLGPLTPDEIPRFFAEIDCLVVPSLWRENSPFVIHEAFACGVPVIASRRGGIPQLLAAGGGVLYEPDRREELPDLLRIFATQAGALSRRCGSPPEISEIGEHAAVLGKIYARVRRHALRARSLPPDLESGQRDRDEVT